MKLSDKDAKVLGTYVEDDVRFLELSIIDGNEEALLHINKEDLQKLIARLDALERLEYLRGEIKAERISMEEIAELQDLIPYINEGDTLLLEWAGVPEN